jgi:SAM-dependent methyltransferase
VQLRELFFGGAQVVKRDAVVADWLKRLPPGGVLLDAGAGPQRLKPLCRHLKYISQDFAQYKGGETFAGEQTAGWDTSTIDIVSDISAIPLADSSVDHILCVEVFEHIPEPSAAIKEFHRLLTRGGSVLITTPFNSQYHQDPYFFYSGFSSYWFEHFAKANGFVVERLIPNGTYYESIAQEVLRIASLKSGVLRAIYPPLAAPFLLMLKVFDALKIQSPKAPFGYIVELRKA